MLHKTRGIVFNHVKYGDTSIVATIYTELLGRKSFMIQGVFSKRSKFPPSFFQPFTLLEIQVDQKPNRNLQRIKDISLVQSFHSIPFDTAKSAITIFLAEILSKTVKEVESNQALFQYLFHSIQLLDISETGIANFHLVFLMYLTKYLGFYPIDNYSDTNCLFDLNDGKFNAQVMKSESSAMEISLLIHTLMNISFTDMETLSLSHQKRLLLLKALIEYYNRHLDGIGEIKSLPVLQSVFED